MTDRQPGFSTLAVHAGAQDYLKKYPRGKYAFEPRFRLAEMLQLKNQYLMAPLLKKHLRRDYIILLLLQFPFYRLNDCR